MAGAEPRGVRPTIAAIGLIGAIFAVARLRSLRSLSPPDLAFFHQASWNAARGRGFAQTALEFDAGTLLGSIHLSLVRLLWVPLSALWHGPELLVATQGIVLSAGAAGAGLLAVDRDQRTPALALLLGLSPFALALGSCDLRPLTFVVVPAVLVAAGLAQARLGWVVVGGLGAILAREEAVWVLAALLPFGVTRVWKRRAGLPALAALVGLVGLAAAVPHLAWGHGSNIQANTDLPGTAAAILAGERPLIRWPVELAFLGRASLAALPAVLCPELLVPGLLGWGFLAVFSELEPAAPGQAGLHYLSVVAPFFLAATAVGVGRAARLLHGQRLWLLAALSVVVAGPELMDGARWTSQALRTDGLQQHVRRISALPGGVLTVSQAAPLLSSREVVRIQGHFTPTPERVMQVAAEIDYALLPAGRPADDPPADEWDRWQDALPSSGLKPVAEVEGVVVWERTRLD